MALWGSYGFPLQETLCDSSCCDSSRICLKIHNLKWVNTENCDSQSINPGSPIFSCAMAIYELRILNRQIVSKSRVITTGNIKDLTNDSANLEQICVL